MRSALLAALVLGLAGGAAFAQSSPAMHNRIDLVRPDAPELAAYGALAVGVRTIDFVHKDQPDIAKITPGTPGQNYDRKLVVEVWYPADGNPAATSSGAYGGVLLRDGRTKVALAGRATRDAPPKPLAQGAAPYPLVILSHGYPGNRFLMSPLAENLASKGYVVASIDHTDSTYSDQSAFGSTLVNRPLDQKFVLSEMARLGREDGHFLEGLVDAEDAGLIGYSMGGYGAVISAGAGVTATAVGFPWGAPDGTLAIHQAGSASFGELPDERIKAVVAIAPWGMQRGFWDAEGLAGLTKPILFIAGSADDVSGYEDGVRAIYEGSVNADRTLLTFENANHNAAAPMPAPVESWKRVEGLDFVPFEHYADAVWDTVRMNNITQHFVTAFLGEHLKGETALNDYLTVATEEAAEGVFAANEDGSFKPEHTYWKGFANRTAQGLRLEHAEPAP